MVSPLSKLWDVMPVKADHSMELLHRRRGIDHREISERVDFLGSGIGPLRVTTWLSTSRRVEKKVHFEGLINPNQTSRGNKFNFQLISNLTINFILQEGTTIKHKILMSS